MLDQPVAPLDGIARLDRVAILVGDGSGGEIAFAVGEGLIELHREAVLKVGQHIFAGRHVYPNVIPLIGRAMLATSDGVCIAVIR